MKVYNMLIFILGCVVFIFGLNAAQVVFTPEQLNSIILISLGVYFAAVGRNGIA